MSVSLSNGKLDELRRMMQSMLHEAQIGNWEELARLDVERRVLIDYPAGSFLESALAPGKTESNAVATGRIASSSKVSNNKYNNALAEEIAELDRQIIDFVQKARQLLVEETRGVRAQVSAKKGYETASTMHER